MFECAEGSLRNWGERRSYCVISAEVKVEANTDSPHSRDPECYPSPLFPNNSPTLMHSCSRDIVIYARCTPYLTYATGTGAAI